MLSEEEQKLYFWLTAFWVQGAGAIVDLGCFAGGSTARLAEGLTVAGHMARLHAYDRFTADEATKHSILYAQGVPPFPDRNILGLTRSLLAPWAQSVALHPGEIESARWDDGPIEILLVDAAKSAASMDRMSETFLPNLIPGRSLLVHQDFLHWNQPWIAAQMEALNEFFVPVAAVPRDTIVFLCRRVPQAADVMDARTADLSDRRLTSLLLRARRRFASWRLGNRFADLQAAMAHNPGCRRAFQFERPAASAIGPTPKRR
jgi:hypothetical protein